MNMARRIYDKVTTFILSVIFWAWVFWNICATIVTITVIVFFAVGGHKYIPTIIYLSQNEPLPLNTLPLGNF